KTEGFSPASTVRKVLTNFDVLEVGPLPRRLIRKMSNAVASDEIEGGARFNVVMNQIKSEGLPKSPYIAMLLLWANKKKVRGEKLNEALLLQNVLEHLLGRADFRTTVRGEIGATGKEIVLQHISRLFTDNGRRIEENDLL